MIIAQKPRLYPRVKAVENPPYFPSDLRYDHDFTISPYLPRGFTFSRSGTALAWQGGQYVSKSSNVERIEDLDSLGFSGRKGLLIEGARTNLITRSHEFDNAAWVKNLSATVTADAAVSPDGTSIADEANFPAGGHLSRTCALADGATGTFSCWVKQATSGSATHVRLSSTNTLAFNTGTSTKVALTSSWQRISITWANSGSSSIDCIVGAKDAAGSNDAQCIGKVLIWGAQFEAAAFPSSPIPTAGSAATRNAETCSRSVVLPSGGFSDGIRFIAPPSPASGSFAEVKTMQGGTAGLFEIWIGSNNALSITVNGVGSISMGALVSGSLYNLQYNWAPGAGGLRGSINGGSVVSGAGGSVIDHNVEGLGCRIAGTFQLFSPILRCNASPTRWRPPVSDAELKALSTLT